MSNTHSTPYSVIQSNPTGAWAAPPPPTAAPKRPEQSGPVVPEGVHIPAGYRWDPRFEHSRFKGIVPDTWGCNEIDRQLDIIEEDRRQAAQRRRWALEEEAERAKAPPPPPTIEERLAALEARVTELEAMRKPPRLRTVRRLTEAGGEPPRAA